MKSHGTTEGALLQVKSGGITLRAGYNHVAPCRAGDNVGLCNVSEQRVDQLNDLSEAGSPPPRASRPIAGQTRKNLEAELAAILRRSRRDSSLPGWPYPIGLRDRIAEEQGEGWWEFIKISPQLIVYTAEAEYKTDTWIENPSDRWFKIRILITGTLLDRDGEELLTGPGAHLEVFPGRVGGGFVVKGGRRLGLVGLICQPELLVDTLRLDKAAISSPLNLLLELKSGVPETATFNLSPDVLHSANDIIRARTHLPEGLRRAYIEAKSHEIVCAVLAQLQRKKPRVNGKTKLSLRDLGRLYEARDIILESYRYPPSIPQLALRVGINQTKLKAGFNIVFGCTVHDLIQKVRMERASALLVNTSLTVAEVSYLVGYEYPANFTSAFKRFFGHRPRDVNRPHIE